MSSSFVVSGQNEVTSIWFPANGASHYVWLNILIDIKKRKQETTLKLRRNRKRSEKQKVYKIFLTKLRNNVDKLIEEAPRNCIDGFTVRIQQENDFIM